MVRKFDINGRPYHEPPYTWEEEMEFYRRTGRGPITVLKGPPLEQRQPAKRIAKRKSTDTRHG